MFAAGAAAADEERNGMFKLIPHCAKGSWVVSQSVGTTPVILGRKLATSYHTNDRYKACMQCLASFSYPPQEVLLTPVTCLVLACCKST
jgi:hypothetical protein